MYEEYLELLKQFITFKSVSTDPKYKEEILKCVEWLKNLFNSRGFKIETIEGFGNPIFLATYITDPTLPTCLIYGHYDVQPAEISDGWRSDPFKLNIETDRIFGRGVVDNKGQVLIHIASVFKLITEKSLRYNVKFIIEGDEESGSENIEEFFKGYKDKLNADFVMVSDGELTSGAPTLDSSFRGIINSTLTVKTSDKDNHSGIYGGTIPNAATELINILSKLHDKEGRLSIPGINEKIIDEEIKINNRQIPYSEEELFRITGAKIRLNSEEIDLYTQSGFLTSAEITGISSGYIGEGYKNAIPGKAMAKINFRLAPNLLVKDAKILIKTYLDKLKPDFVELEINFEQTSDAILIDTKNSYSIDSKKIAEKIYNKKVLDKACGAIIPIADYFNKYLNLPVVMIGLGNEDCNMHGTSENFNIEDLKKALNFSNNFFRKE